MYTMCTWSTTQSERKKKTPNVSPVIRVLPLLELFLCCLQNFNNKVSTSLYSLALLVTFGLDMLSPHALFVHARSEITKSLCWQENTVVSSVL